jgi:hypothetical protein
VGGRGTGGTTADHDDVEEFPIGDGTAALEGCEIGRRAAVR